GAASGIEAGVQKDRAEQRLECVGENRRTLCTPAALLAFAQPDHTAEVEGGAEAGQYLAVHEIRAHSREIAFGDVGEPPVKYGRDCAVQHGVADELEALVVPGPKTGVRQRRAQELGVRKYITEPVKERVGRHPERRNPPPSSARGFRLELEIEAYIAGKRQDP